MTIKEAKIQAKVGVGIEAFWNALSKDLASVVPKAMPNFVTDIEVLEEDGGSGTVLVFNFGSGVPHLGNQKERIVDFDESLHRIGLEVIEGGYLNLGFSSYKTIFQLTASGESETIVDAKAVYETGGGAEETDQMPLNTSDSTLTFIRCLENYLLNQGS